MAKRKHQTNAKERRVLAAQVACMDALAAMYAAGNTDPNADLHTAKRRSPTAERTAYLQAKDHLRQISRIN